METKICTKCGIDKALNCFHKCSNKMDGLKSWCKDCCKIYKEKNNDRFLAYRKKYYQENTKYYFDQRQKFRETYPQYFKEYGQKYRKDNREKVNRLNQKREAQKRGLFNSLTLAQWESIKLYFNYQCAYCGKETSLTQDHFIPLSKGGEYTRNNILPVCGSCNSSKSNKDFFEWYISQHFYSKRRESKILKFLHYGKNQNQQLMIG